MLTSASSDLAKVRFGDGFYYLKHQLLYGFAVGLIGFLFTSFFYYRVWEKISVLLLILSLGLLVLVFTPLGLKIYGSERWLNLGGITLQPGEIVKLTFLIYLAAWVSKNKMRRRSVSEGFLPFLTLVGVVTLLLVMQPSTTTAVLIFGASLLTYFTAGARFRFLIAALFLSVLAFSLLIYFTPYRLERVLSFLNPEADQLNKTYHINQALIAIGSGGLTGVGFGQSTTKLKYLPEPLSDSIFAVIGEELGFVGSLFVIIAFLIFVWRGLMIGKRAPDDFGRLMVTGFISLIGLQAFINIGAISGLIPLTGVPLPFISYGGTALAVFLTMGGIIVNVSKYRR
jgi:cell division protein FtsW